MDHLPDTGSPSKKLVVVSRTEVVKDELARCGEGSGADLRGEDGKEGMGRRGWGGEEVGRDASEVTRSQPRGSPRLAPSRMIKLTHESVGAEARHLVEAVDDRLASGDAVAREVAVVGGCVEARARTALVVGARSAPLVLAGEADRLQLCIERLLRKRRTGQAKVIRDWDFVSFMVVFCGL